MSCEQHRALQGSLGAFHFPSMSYFSLFNPTPSCLFINSLDYTQKSVQTYMFVNLLSQPLQVSVVLPQFLHALSLPAFQIPELFEGKSLMDLHSQRATLTRGLWGAHMSQEHRSHSTCAYEVCFYYFGQSISPMARASPAHPTCAMCSSTKAKQTFLSPYLKIVKGSCESWILLTCTHPGGGRAKPPLTKGE